MIQTIWIYLTYIMFYKSLVNSALEINGEDYIIEAKYEDDLFYISMDDKNYEDVDQFFQNAMIHDEPLYSQYVNVNYLEMLD